MSNHWYQQIPRRRPWAMLSVSAAALLTANSCAQDAAAPAKLQQMRQIYEQELAKLKLPILQQLSVDLEKLERSLTQENRLEEAVKARAERQRIGPMLRALEAKSSAEIAPDPEAATTPDTEVKEFSIPMGSANLQGRLKRPKSGAYISDWVSSSCQATWSGGQIIPGLYDVYIDFDTFWQRSGGQLKFEELNQDFHFTIPGGQARKTVKVGTLKLGSALGFTIKADSKNPYGIIRLHGVTFKPVAQ